METFADRLKALLRERSTTGVAVAKRLDIKPRTFRSWTSGDRVPPRDQLLLLAEEFGVTTDFLISGRRPSEDAPLVPDTSMLGVPMSDFVQVREYGAHFTAGPKAISRPVEVIGEFAFRSSWLRQLTSSPGECYLVRVKGDSMEPTIPDGAVVLIDQQQRDPKLGRKGIFALRIEDEVLVKRLELVDDTLLVESDNPEYSTRLVPKPKPPLVDILGKVIWQSSILPNQ